MKFAVNVEFTDDELRKYAEDVGRRWTVGFFQQAFKTGQRLKLNPSMLNEIGLALASALGANSARPQPDPGPTADEPIPYVPMTRRERCERLEASQFIEEGWVCHLCDTYNGVQRSVCRHCDHERCDIVVPPPPRQDDPSVQ